MEIPLVWDMDSMQLIPLQAWMRYCPWIVTPRWTHEQWEEYHDLTKVR